MSDAKMTAAESLTLIALWVLCLASYWYVGPILWRWYAVPLGVPAVTWREFAGFSLLVGLMTHRYRKPDDGFEAGVSRSVGSMIAPWMGLFFGWLLLP